MSVHVFEEFDLTIDPLNSPLISVSEVAQSLPNTPHPESVRRWMVNGIDGYRLPSVRVGRSRYTTEEAVRAFIRRLTTDSTGGE